MASFLPIALPVIISPAIIVLTKTLTTSSCVSCFIDITATMAAPQAPDIIPQISPITSQQMLLTTFALFASLTANLAPFTLRADIAYSGSKLQEVEATPIMSAMIEIMTITKIRI